MVEHKLDNDLELLKTPPNVGTMSVEVGKQKRCVEIFTSPTGEPG